MRDESPGAGGSHGAQSEFLVELLDAAHPITKGMPMKWKHAKDELYDSLRGPGTNMKILAYAHSEKSKKNEPMMMRHATVTQMAAKDMKPCRNTPRKPSRSK